MRQKEILPCSCHTCYFCVTGITKGVAHPDMSQPRSATGVTKKRKRRRKKSAPAGACGEYVDLQKGSQDCKICYRDVGKKLRAAGEKPSRKDIRNHPDFHKATKGCVGCGCIHVCNWCQPTFKHDFVSTKK
jgi:hypothetical protein